MASLARADMQAMMAMHSAVISSDARRAMVKSVAALKMEKDHHRLFLAIDKVTKPCRGLRNNFAHHIWGACDELPDAMLLIDPTAIIDFRVWLATSSRADSRPNHHDRMFVYFENDLKEAVKTMEEGLALVSTFVMLGHERGEVRAETQKLLESQPQVAQALQSLSRKNGPEIQ
ncbi:hypothetical protein [Mesorhizobium sp.]|uniref:hypothetical protein n=1 Tax=Mesorhizobium sp. TaxID=1871066 RepID=UPI000FE7BD46|nr:hypothetical protein [Mesorhizobium sp.]RWM26887.1 MAG: hypothetical protein EOR74_13860 [Mesorhizobium sp.]